MFFYFYLKDIPRTMYICLIGLFLATFQVTCDGAPGRSFLALKRPANVSQEKKLVEKSRARKYSPWFLFFMDIPNTHVFFFYKIKYIL